MRLKHIDSYDGNRDMNDLIIKWCTSSIFFLKKIIWFSWSSILVHQPKKWLVFTTVLSDTGCFSGEALQNIWKVLDQFFCRNVVFLLSCIMPGQRWNWDLQIASLSDQQGEKRQNFWTGWRLLLGWLSKYLGRFLGYPQRPLRCWVAEVCRNFLLSHL